MTTRPFYTNAASTSGASGGGGAGPWTITSFLAKDKGDVNGSGQLAVIDTSKQYILGICNDIFGVRSGGPAGNVSINALVPGDTSAGVANQEGPYIDIQTTLLGNFIYEPTASSGFFGSTTFIDTGMTTYVPPAPFVIIPVGLGIGNSTITIDNAPAEFRWNFLDSGAFTIAFVVLERTV